MQQRQCTYWGAFTKPLLSWKSDKYYVFWVCVLACVGECFCVRVGVDAWSKGAAECLSACSLTNPARDAPPCCHLRPLWLHQFVRHYLIKGTIFGKKLLNIKYVFWFSLQRLFKTFLILRRTKRDIFLNTKSLRVKYSLFLPNCNKIWIFSTDFRQNWIINFHQNPSSGSRVLLCRETDREADGRTDGHDEGNSRSSQFRE